METETLSYASPAPLRKHGEPLALLTLATAALPTVCGLFFSPSRDSPGTVVAVLGILGSPLILAFAVTLCVLYRKQPLALGLSVLAALATGLPLFALAWVMVNGPPC